MRKGVKSLQDFLFSKIYFSFFENILDFLFSRKTYREKRKNGQKWTLMSTFCPNKQFLLENILILKSLQDFLFSKIFQTFLHLFSFKTPILYDNS